MAKKPNDDLLTDEEAEQRATLAIRHALTTPHKPQTELIGKTGRSWTHPRKKKRKNLKKG